MIDIKNAKGVKKKKKKSKYGDVRIIGVRIMGSNL